MSEQCRLCKGEPFDDVDKDDQIPLCQRHWNWWLTRYVMSEDLPPCGASLIQEATTDGRTK